MPPAIISPVSQQLPVSDTARSMDFYSNVLAFTKVAETEMVNGPAHILFYRAIPSSPTILFFEVDDVTAMHSAILARGGQPTLLTKVNWIKMEMFQVNDPDGNTLWFGKSFHEEYADRHTEAGKGQLRVIMPSLPWTDVTAGVNFYRDVLGFSVNYQQHDIGVMDRDSVRLLLVARKTGNPSTGTCYVYIKNADELYKELLAKGANIPTPPASQPWGLREFEVIDPEGNRISFGQTFE